MFMAYELALNQEVQDKLLAEIDEANRNNGNKPATYEFLQSMKYFDCVVQGNWSCFLNKFLNV